jgi:hypothetical protein
VGGQLGDQLDDPLGDGPLAEEQPLALFNLVYRSATASEVPGRLPNGSAEPHRRSVE